MTIGEFQNKTLLSKFDSGILLESVLEVNSAYLLINADKVIPDSKLTLLQKYEAERLSGIPLAYVLQMRSFYKSVFCCPKGVLIPQPDTEVLVQEAVKTAVKFENKGQISILDLCAGTGCIGISVACELASVFNEVELTLSDISETAYQVFSKNAENILNQPNITVFKNLGNLFEGITEKFDLILTNPPYIETNVIPTLDAEVRQEPLLALDGGKDGLDLIRQIITQAKLYLRKKGYILTEIGYDQQNSVESLFMENNYTEVQTFKDLADLPRVVKANFLSNMRMPER